jgi:gas vesicle protein
MKRKKSEGPEKEEIMARNESNFIEVSFAFLLGSLVGATTALLSAPTSGEQTRRRIRERSGEVHENLRTQYGKISDKAEIEVSRLKDRVNERVNQAKDYYERQKSKVREAVEEGRRAYEEDEEKELPASTSENA